MDSLDTLINKIDSVLKKAKEEKPIGLLHPQEVFGRTIKEPSKDKPVETKKTRHRDMSKLIPKVIMEKVNRNGKIFFRRRTIMVRIDEEMPHDKVTEIELPTKKFKSKYWIYYTMKEYASRQEFTKPTREDKRNFAWRDPEMEALYFIYKKHTEYPEKTVLVYNNKLREKVLLVAKEKAEEQSKEKKKSSRKKKRR